MEQFLAIEKCNRKIAIYAIIIIINFVILTIGIIAMTCHANYLRENSNKVGIVQDVFYLTMQKNRI